MKINNVTCLITAINEKVNANTKEPYKTISLVTLDGDGTALNINIKDIEFANTLKVMNRYIFNLSLSVSQYGMKIELPIYGIVKDLGGIEG